MQILITGAAGMIGRKLTDAILQAKAIGDHPVKALHLADVIPPEPPASDGVKITTSTTDLTDPDAARTLTASRPDVIFHLAAVVSGQAETNLDLGFPSIWMAPAPYWTPFAASARAIVRA